MRRAGQGQRDGHGTLTATLDAHPNRWPAHAVAAARAMAERKCLGPHEWAYALDAIAVALAPVLAAPRAQDAG